MASREWPYAISVRYRRSIGTYLDAAKWYGRLQLGGSKRCTFSETMDIRDFTVCIIRCVYRAELILGTATVTVVYLSNKDHCPKILAHKSEIKVA